MKHVIDDTESEGLLKHYETKAEEQIKDLVTKANKLTDFTRGADLNQRGINEVLKEIDNLAFNNQDQSEILTKLDKDVCGVFFKVHYALNQENLATLFYCVAKLKYLQADISGNPKDYTDSATACMYTLSIEGNITEAIADKLISNSPELISLKTSSYELLTQSYDKLIKLCSLSEGHQPIKIGDNSIDYVSQKPILTEIRESSSGVIDAVIGLRSSKATEADAKYVRMTAQMFSDVAEVIQKYLGSLFERAELIIGKPPCAYTVIGLGSLALKQITPYSDLEFGILTENDEYKLNADPKIRNYFKNMSHIAHFQNICLGETIIPTSSYKIDLRKYVRQAVNFDLGGKTSLGRIDDFKPYDLVQTVEGMIVYAKNFDKTSDHIDKNLANILEKVCFIHGNESLLDEYNSKLSAFIFETSNENKDLTNCQYRAFEIMYKGVEEINYNSPQMESKTIRGNLEQFQFDFASSSMGKLFDVKQEIYRVPDRFIYNLGKLFNVVGNSSWDTLEKLYDSGQINGIAKLNLQKALSFACLLRAKTYDHYKCQKEKMSSLPGQNSKLSDLSKVFTLGEENLEVDGPLFEFFYTMIPLRKTLSECCKGMSGGSLSKLNLETENFYDDYIGIKLDICIRLMKWETGLKLANELLEGKENLEEAPIIKLKTGIILGELSQYQDALEYGLKALDLFREVFGEKHPNVALSLNNVGSVYDKLGQYQEALGYGLKALDLTREIFGEKNTAFGISLSNVGATYDKLGQYQKALKYGLESLNLIRELQEEKHPDVVLGLNNVGMVYVKLGQYKEALEYGLKALDLTREIFGEKHPNIAPRLNNVGIVYVRLGQYKEALEYGLKSLDLTREIFGEKHDDVARGLNNVGMVYMSLGQYKEALEYGLKALDLTREIFGEKHDDVARGLNNVGLVYMSLGQYQEALEYGLKSLDLTKEIFGEKHPNVAVSLNNVGLAYMSLGQCQGALEYGLKSLDLTKEIFGEKHADVARGLNNVGMIYVNLGQYEKALEYGLKSLNLMQEIFGEKHADVARGLNDVGLVYEKLGQYEKALEYGLKSLNLMQEIFGEKHADIARSLNDVGLVYMSLGQYQKALGYELKALDLTREIFGEKHSIVATSLNNVGMVYEKLGQYQEALEYELKALNLAREIFGETHPSVALSLNNVGLVYMKLGQYQEALDYGLKALDLYIEIFGEKHPNVVLSLNNVGLVYMSLGQYQGALEYGLKSLDLTKEIFGEKHADVALILNNVGGAYGELGQHQEALEYGLKALDLYREIFGEKHPDFVRSLNNINHILNLQQNELIGVDRSSIAEANLERGITSFAELPIKSGTSLRVISYNIVAEFFDNRDTTEQKIHTWSVRSEFCKELIEKVFADIFCLQELSPLQAYELGTYFYQFGYKARFLSQTPSEIEAGKIVGEDQVEEWIGMNMGTPLIGTFFSYEWNLVEEKCFWLKPDPDDVPVNRDRGDTDKGFGNMNTYRAVLCTKLTMADQPSKSVYVFNSHYPLSGDSNTRKQCAALEMKKIKEIAEDVPWISAGDRNLISSDNDTEENCTNAVYKEFTSSGYDIRDCGEHYGISTTWIGFTYDNYRNHVKSSDGSTDFKNNTVLDLIISSMKANISFHLHGAFDPITGLLPLTGQLPEDHESFVSDHALVGADFTI